ncbi:MAG: lipid-A-disaccharide synthase [Deltaproteobacteria bacterium]|nr:lipid-A-disaccharide synthase [Deltaproteobacteria bacterium]
MNSPPFNIVLSAGEPSGDLIAAQVAAELKKIEPRCRLFGMGGPRLAETGCDVVTPMPAVMGLGGPVAGAGHIAASIARLVRAAVSRKVAAAILVDFPDFHLALARMLHMAGIPVFQFVSPQIWAWRPGRIKTIKRYVTKTFLIFPFEQAIYDKAGIPARFVGHPIVDRMRRLPSKTAARKTLGIAPGRPVIALLPGSRAAVLKRHLPAFGAAARAVSERVHGMTFICSIMPGIDERFYRSAFSLQPSAFSLVLSRADGPVILRAADAAIISSGTGALEAVLAATPFCGVYVTSPFTYNIVKRMAGVERILMVNILAGRDVVREFVQYEARPEAIAGEVASLIRDSGRRRAMRSDFREVRKMLGPGGAAARVAKEVVGFCTCKERDARGAG